jgi:hypothetical protein
LVISAIFVATLTKALVRFYMSKRFAGHFLAVGGKARLQHALIGCAALLALASITSRAQDDNVACPCFNEEEVQASFDRAESLSVEEGSSLCKAEDYSVELNAEITIFDNDFLVSGQARVEWFDYDPGSCTYVDATGDPVLERHTKWPHPAPESIARACYNIVATVISQSDTTGRCITM